MEHFQRVIGSTRLDLITGDLTRQEIAAIVNAANSDLSGGGGVDGAIHAAGGAAIMDECRAIIAGIGSLPAGQAVVTSGGNLPARFVIHAVGPVWHGGEQDEDLLLRAAYVNSLERARENRIPNVAFPSLSTGAYRFPVARAAKVAIAAIADYLAKFPAAFTEIRMVLWRKEDFEAYRAALNDDATQEPRK